MNYAQNSDLERHFFFFFMGLRSIEDEVDVFFVLLDFLHVWRKTRRDVSPRDINHLGEESVVCVLYDGNRKVVFSFFFLRRIAQVVRSTFLISASLTRWRQKTWHHAGHLTSSHPVSASPGLHWHQRSKVNLYALSELNESLYSQRV